MNKFIVFVLLCFLAIGVVACKTENIPNSEDFTDVVYLANSAMNGLAESKINLEGDSLENKINSIINVLKLGNQDGKAVIPAMVNVINTKVIDKNVVISFDDTYLKMTPVEEILCRSSIVKSLTELNGISSVEFYIGSVPYQNANGTVFGAMGPDDVVLDFAQEMTQEVTKKVTLYFADQLGTFLVPVEYELSINSDEQIEKTILNLLIQGPSQLSSSGSESLISLVPIETKIISVYTNEGVCFVDLSEEFITKHMGGSTGEMLTIYSIVNTITNLDNINKVQFLIEGAKRAEFKGHIEFDGLFQRNLDLIKNN